MQFNKNPEIFITDMSDPHKTLKIDKRNINLKFQRELSGLINIKKYNQIEIQNSMPSILNEGGKKENEITEK